MIPTITLNDGEAEYLRQKHVLLQLHADLSRDGFLAYLHACTFTRADEIILGKVIRELRGCTSAARVRGHHGFGSLQWLATVWLDVPVAHVLGCWTTFIRTGDERRGSTRWRLILAVNDAGVNSAIAPILAVPRDHWLLPKEPLFLTEPREALLLLNAVDLGDSAVLFAVKNERSPRQLADQTVTRAVLDELTR